MRELRGKRAQVTIFIVLAIVIVIGVVIFFLLSSGSVNLSSVSGSSDPLRTIQKCSQDSARTIILNLSASNLGSIFKGAKLVDYNGQNVVVLCDTSSNDVACTNSYPLLKRNVELAIKRFVEPKLKNCFEGLKNEYGDLYSQGDLSFDVTMTREKINLDITRKVDIQDGEGVKSFSNFNNYIYSSLFDLLAISGDILNKESNCDCSVGCNVDIGNFNMAYPMFKIKRVPINDSKIYTVEDSQNNKFIFAVRNCGGFV